MLRDIASLLRYRLCARDGEVGRVTDFLFDDATWEIRYLAVQVGTRLSGRVVVLPPRVTGKPVWSTHSIPVALTCEQVRASGDINTVKPVSRQQLDLMHGHYEWPSALAGTILAPAPLLPPPLSPLEEQEIADEERQNDPHLRSVREVLTYGIQCTDGAAGRMADLIMDDVSWKVTHMVLSTGNHRCVLIPSSGVESIAWAQRSVRVQLTRDTIRKSPEFDPSTPVNREYEMRLYDYFGRPRDLAPFADP